MKKILCILFAAVLALSGCARKPPAVTPTPGNPRQSANPEPVVETTIQPTNQNAQSNAVPPLPNKISNAKDGKHTITVYDVDKKASSEMDIEEYLCGVLAGEMRNDWPLEALKAQAVLARTFTLQFLTDKPSSSLDPNADISTDVKESQAYKPEEISPLVRQAVQETKGMALAYDGKFIHAWFHSCAGGKTATATEGLNFKEGDLPYIVSVDSDEAEAVDTAKEWSNTFTENELMSALTTIGTKVDSIQSVEQGDKGPSGRTVNLVINGQKVNTADLRVAIDATKFRSTLITDLKYQNNKLSVSGKGFGHGVGMSQWGAYTMAKKGSTYEDIIKHYFKDINIVKAWD